LIALIALPGTEFTTPAIFLGLNVPRKRWAKA